MEARRAIEWKRFELLCAKCYDSVGFKTEMLAAGADGGIDIGLYKLDHDRPPAIVQRKASSAAQRGHPLRGKAGAGHARRPDRAAHAAHGGRRIPRLSGTAHPRDLLDHTCMRARFASGAMIRWEFERNGDTVTIDPSGPLLVQVGGAIDLAVDVAVAGTGTVYLFEDWLRLYIDHGLLEPVLESWWPRFSGAFLYHPGRWLLPAPLRAFVDFIRNEAT